MPLTKKVLSKYLNPIFIETGTYNGDCVCNALNLGFRNIHTIEIDKGLCDQCKKRFLNIDNVNIYQGSSSDWLPIILKKISMPATIWLDAHPLIGDIALNNIPLLQELRAIEAESSRLKFKILIDDMSLFSIREKKYILEIANRIGKLTYEGSKVSANDILAIIS
jgi:hypothetical protein